MRRKCASQHPPASPTRSHLSFLPSFSLLSRWPPKENIKTKSVASPAIVTQMAGFDHLKFRIPIKNNPHGESETNVSPKLPVILTEPNSFLFGSPSAGVIFLPRALLGWVSLHSAPIHIPIWPRSCPCVLTLWHWERTFSDTAWLFALPGSLLPPSLLPLGSFRINSAYFPKPQEI